MLKVSNLFYRPILLRQGRYWNVQRLTIISDKSLNNQVFTPITVNSSTVNIQSLNIRQFSDNDFNKFKKYKVSQERYYLALRVLGCDSSTKFEQVKEKFARFAKIYHPDIEKTGDIEKFINLRQAFEEVELYYQQNDPKTLREQQLQHDQELKRKRDQYWKENPKEHKQYLKEQKDIKRMKKEAAEREMQRKRDNAKTKLEQERLEERMRYEQYLKNKKYKEKLKVDDITRQRTEYEAQEQIIRKQKEQQEEQEQLAKQHIDKSSALEKARKDAERRQKIADELRLKGPSEEEILAQRKAQAEQERERILRQKQREAEEKEAKKKQGEGLRVDIKSLRGNQTNNIQQESSQSSTSSQGGDSGGIGAIILLIIFGGAGAYAFTSMQSSNSNSLSSGGDSSKIEPMAPTADDIDQKQRVQEKQEQLRRKLKEQREKNIQKKIDQQTAAKQSGPIRRKYDGQVSVTRRLDILAAIRELETDPDKMKTYPRIPFQRSIKLRPRATPMEAERYFQLNFEQDLDDWIKKGVTTPSLDQLQFVLNETTLKKLDCLPSSSKCQGLNKKVYNGQFEQCGQLAPFYLWRRFIDDSDYDEDVLAFMDQYKIEPFTVPRGAEGPINKFFQSKYGLFTCQDSQEKYGDIAIDPILLQKWEPTLIQRQKTWTLAVLTALSEGVIKIEQLGEYRRNFKQSKNFEKYLKTHPHHERDLVLEKYGEKEKTNLIFKKQMEKQDFLNFNTAFIKDWI